MDKLFSEFPPIPASEWEKKIIEDLKGADYNKKLIWKTLEGIDVKPYYREENIKNLRSQIQSINSLLVADKNLNRNNNDNIGLNLWEIRQDILEDDLLKANKLAIEAIKGGADSISLDFSNVESANDLSLLLKGIDFYKTPIHFFTSKETFPKFKTLEKLLFEVDLSHSELSSRAQRTLHSAQLHGSFNFDPLSYFLLHGEFYENEKKNTENIVYWLQKVIRNYSHFKAITINGQYFHNAGASAVEELAFSLSSANEYINISVNNGISAEEIANSIMLSFGTGSDYFMEIAKLRAARILWNKLIQHYIPVLGEDRVESEIIPPACIHSYTSEYNNTIYDPYNNMLRATTEALSAAIGGADAITVLPYDISFRKPDDFSYKIARNLQLILKYEAYADKVIDASSGSYYIENLTHLIAGSAWNLFKETEAKGGYIEAIKQNFVQNRIADTNKKREARIAKRKQIILGTNLYPNPNETISANIDEDYIQKKNFSEVLDFGKVISEPLKIQRPAQIFENIRLNTEAFVRKGNKRPSVFLFTIGNPSMRRARAAFSLNFFGCAGYEIIDNNGFCNVDDGIKVLSDKKPDIVVICSSDEDYAVYAPDIAEKTKAVSPDIIVIIAGNPVNKFVETLHASSLHKSVVDDFINIQTNLPETLLKFSKKLNLI